MSRFATRVLASPNGLKPATAAGSITTAWATHDEGRWPGLRTRVDVQVTGTEVIVRVHCRHCERGPCSQVMPDGAPLVGLAQRIAHDIVDASPRDRFLIRLRAFKDELCACPDDGCTARVLRNMREWGAPPTDDRDGTTASSAGNAEARDLLAGILSCARS
jgi:hypothetical protein